MPPYNLCIIGLLLLGAFFFPKQSAMKRVIFYFDGFNFYSGLKDKCVKDHKWYKYYWIDIVKFCNQFVGEGSELVMVKYFTSPPMNNGKRSRQSALFGANLILNGEKFKVINGHYTNKTVTCNANCKKNFSVLEEKRTDVNIAVHILMDCLNDLVDNIILVTADSDQIPTIQAVKNKFPTKKLKIYFPPERNSTDIYNITIVRQK